MLVMMQKGRERAWRMRRRHEHVFNLVRLYLFLILFAALCTFSCTCTPDVTGKWREIGNPGTIEFFEDSTFRVVDNQGMSAKGTYSLDKKGTMVFEIAHEGSSPEVIHAAVEVKKGEMTLVFSRTNEILRYAKED